MSVRRMVVLGALVLGCAACHARPPVTAPTRARTAVPLRAEPPAPPPAPMAALLPSRALTPEEAFARESLNDLNASHPLSDAFFDYAQTALRDDARLTLQQDARTRHG